MYKDTFTYKYSAHPDLPEDLEEQLLEKYTKRAVKSLKTARKGLVDEILKYKNGHWTGNGRAKGDMDWNLGRDNFVIISSKGLNRHYAHGCMGSLSIMAAGHLKNSLAKQIDFVLTQPLARYIVRRDTPYLYSAGRWRIPEVLPFVKWLANDSPWAHVFINKEPKDIIFRGAILDGTCPHRLIMQSSIGLRAVADITEVIEVWGRWKDLIKLNPPYNMDMAYLMAQMARAVDTGDEIMKSVVYAPRSGDTVGMNGSVPAMNKEGLNNFLLRTPLQDGFYDASQWRESLSNYPSITAWQKDGYGNSKSPPHTIKWGNTKTMKVQTSFRSMANVHYWDDEMVNDIAQSVIRKYGSDELKELAGV